MKIKARQKIASSCSAIIIKVGTRLLTNTAYIPPLVAQISEIRRRVKKVLLVSSGAVGLGMKAIGLSKRPGALSDIQALAAVGQSRLMSLYDAECAKHGFHAGQLLLTAADINDKERHLNVMNCISSLWTMNVLPVINENDSVSVDELKFGDNDCLAALIAVMMKAELTVLLTGVDGLHTSEGGRLIERVSCVEEISSEIAGMASNTDDKNFSTGGMASKIRAAEIVTSAGEYLWIADGRDASVLSKIMSGEDVGTLFVPSREKQLESRKRWLGFFSKTYGKILVDEGAVAALVEKGKSLLPSGVKSVSGNFKRGDAVSICSTNGQLIGKGLANYPSNELALIAGKKTSQIVSALGYEGDHEAIHRDKLVITAAKRRS